MVKEITKTIKRGDIWLVELGVGNGSVQGGKRPCVVISNDVANTYSPVIHIIPITTRTKTKLPTHVEINHNCGVLKDSTALVEQTTPINKDALINKVGIVDSTILDKLEIAMFIQMGAMNKIKHLLKNRAVVTV